MDLAVWSGQVAKTSASEPAARAPSELSEAHTNRRIAPATSELGGGRCRVEEAGIVEAPFRSITPGLREGSCLYAWPLLASQAGHPLEPKALLQGTNIE